METQKVLMWLREALKKTDENPNNLLKLYAELKKHDKEVEEAVKDAVKPEFEEIADTVASLIRGGSS